MQSVIVISPEISHNTRIFSTSASDIEAGTECWISSSFFAGKVLPFLKRHFRIQRQLWDPWWPTPGWILTIGGKEMSPSEFPAHRAVRVHFKRKPLFQTLEDFGIYTQYFWVEQRSHHWKHCLLACSFYNVSVTFTLKLWPNFPLKASWNCINI